MSKEYMKKANLYADLWISGTFSILCGIALFYIQGWFWQEVYDGLIETELYLRTLWSTGEAVYENIEHQNEENELENSEKEN